MKWLAASFLLVVLIAIALIHSAPVQQLILRQLEGMAQAAGHAFSAKNLRFRPFDFEFSVSGFVYNNRGVRVEVDELTVDVPWNFYRQQGLALNSLAADGLRIAITSSEPVLPEPSGDVTRGTRCDGRAAQVSAGQAFARFGCEWEFRRVCGTAQEV